MSAALTEAEREDLYSPIGNDESYPELPGVVGDIIAARLAAVEERLVAERDAVGDSPFGWYEGCRAGLARALDIVREEAS